MRLPPYSERELCELWRAGASFDLEFASLQTQFDIFRVLKRVAAEYGLKTFLVMRLPKVLGNSLASLSIITSWPAEMINRYDELGLLKESPIVRRMQASVVPFRFDFDAIPQSERQGAVADASELFCGFGMNRGVYMPVHDANGNRAIVAWFGDREPLKVEEVAQLNMVATLIYDRLSQLSFETEKLAEALTDRELDCLVWTSVGKTSAEISEILKLSEHTVNHYLNRAAKKLDTVNRTQAVAKALRIGLIS